MTPISTPHPYKSAHSLTVAVKALLITGAAIHALSLLMVLLGTMITPFTEEEIGDNPMGFAIGLVEAGLGLISVVVYIATAVCFLIWIFRCYSNLPAFGYPRRALGYSAGWAVGSWFIPFVNLVLPYKIVKETWEKSVPVEQTRMSVDERPASFPLWWSFWISANILGNFYRRAALKGDISQTYLATLGVLSEATAILAAMLIFMIVSDIDKRQEESSQSMKLGKYALPPSPPTLDRPQVSMEAPHTF